MSISLFRLKFLFIDKSTDRRLQPRKYHFIYIYIYIYIYTYKQDIKMYLFMDNIQIFYVWACLFFLGFFKPSSYIMSDFESNV